MYTAMNVEKFFADQLLCGGWIVKQEVVQTIVDRANWSADEAGCLPSGRVSEVFGDDQGLVARFWQTFHRDLDHINIARKALART